MQAIRFLRKVHPLVFISLLYGVISFLLFERYGIKNVNDSHRYIEYAANLHNGFYMEKHNFWYFGYVLFVYLHSLISSSFGLLIATQYLLGLFSVLALYKTSRLLFQNTATAVATCLLYVLFIDIPSWNSYILAESFYTSMVCFSLYFLALLRNGRKGWKLFVVGTGVLILTFLAKPTGLVFAIAFATVILLHYIRKIRSRTSKWVLGGAVAIGTLVIADNMLETYQVIENYQLGEIIYAVKTIPSLPSLGQLVVEPPSELTIPPAGDSKIWQIVQFIVQNPIYWTELFLKKVYYFLSHTRPFWSNVHNLYSLLILLPSYFLFARVLLKRRVESSIAIFSVVYVVMHTISIGLTSVDWDGRFLIPVLPVIFLLAGKGLSGLLRKNQTELK